MRVLDGVIVEVGSNSTVDRRGADVIDLGDVALLPRLVNAHTHLEFSDCGAPIGDPGIRLADWIGKVIAARGIRSTDERNGSIASGLQESIESGVGLIGDIATTPSSYPARTDPARTDASVVSFAEVLGLSQERSSERLASAEDHWRSLAGSSSVTFAVSPHAPYSTPRDVIDRCIQLAGRRQAPVAMHVAESPDERELLESGTGPFAETLRGAGLLREGLFPWGGADVFSELIDRLSESPRALLVHGNDLRETEIDRIAGHDSLSVVYCPRTHHFFGYDPHPVGRLLARGVRVALGTDSRASNPDLSLWKEIQFLLHHRPDLDPYAVLEMGTCSGAGALLGAESEFGKIAGGLVADTSLVALATSAETLDQVWHDFATRDLLCSPLTQRA